MEDALIANDPCARHERMTAARNAGTFVSMKIALLIFGVVLAFTIRLPAQERGVIDDPDGFTNLRATPSTTAKIVATVKQGQVFTFDAEPGDAWCEVKLASGKKGWMHASRIRRAFSEKDLPEKSEPDDEIESYARSKGTRDYAATARAAAHGDAKAMEQFFALTGTDGAAAEEHIPILAAVFHLIGDERFSVFLSARPIDYQLAVRHLLADGEVTYPFGAAAYLSRCFPKTAALLFRGEIVDWFSPDGRYTIRKVFSAPHDLKTSRVSRSELVEKSSGRVIHDLTEDDEGQGADREGEVFWSVDSRRFAAYSCGEYSGHTTVFQIEGDAVRLIPLPVDPPPGRDADAQLKAAKLVHCFIEPVRWITPTTLALDRREYFRSTDSSATIHDIGRYYHITVELSADGRAAMKEYAEEK